MNVDFRRMHIEDLDAVHEIECDLFKDAWSKNSFLYEIKNDSYSFPYVLIINGSIAGFCVCWFYNNELHIGNVAIKKDCQGKGYGTLLMQKLLGLFPGFKQAFLEVNVSNDAAIGLYLNFGFNIIATRKAYYATGEDALVMIKEN